MMKIFNKNKKVVLLTGLEILAVVVTLFFAISYLIKNDISSNSKNNQKAYIEPTKVYALTENPQFEITAATIGPNSKDVNVKVEHSTGAEIDVTVKKEKKDNGDYEVTLERSENFRPGKYQLIVTGDEASIYEDFYWGVLAVNTNKSVYMPNDEAFLQLGVLDQWGHTMCNANLKLEVAGPDEKTKTVEIKNSPSCGRDNVVDTADYYSNYKTGGPGTYTITLTNLDNNFVLATQFKVEENPMFSVERIGAMRINPFKADSYLMTIKIKAFRDFNGTVEEYLPNSFKADGQEANKITWNMSLSAGEEKTLTYNYTAPTLSPQFYLLGPLRILVNGEEVFRESRAWQIASDAAIASARSGSWEVVTTWAGSAVPVAGDTVTIGAFVINVVVGASAASVDFTGATGTIRVGAGAVLQLSSALVGRNAADASRVWALSGPGTINVPVVHVGNHTNPTTSATARATRFHQGGPIINATSLIINSESGTNLNTGSYVIASGTANVSGDITNNNEAAANTSIFTTGSAPGTGVLNIGGNWLKTGNGASTATRNFGGSSSLINYMGTAEQLVIGGGVYVKLKINNNVRAYSSNNVTSALSVFTIGDERADSIYDGGGGVLVSSGVLNLVSGTFKLGSGNAAPWPAFTTNNISPGTTVEYTSAVDQTVSTTPTYSNLTFSGTGIKTPANGTLNVASTWSIGSPTTLLTNNTIVSTSGNLSGTGTLTQGSGSISLDGNWAHTGTFTTGSAQVILTGSAMQISGSDGGIRFHGLTVNGSYTNTNTSTVTVSSALAGTGKLTQAANTTLDIDGDTTIAILNATGDPNTVSFTGANQTVSGNYYFHDVSFTGTSARTVTFVGNSIIHVGFAGSLTFSGAPANKLTLASSDANPWKLNVDPYSSTVTVSNISVSKSDASGFKQIDASDGTNTDGGANLNWLFDGGAVSAPAANIDGVNIQGLNFD